MREPLQRFRDHIEYGRFPCGDIEFPGFEQSLLRRKGFVELIHPLHEWQGQLQQYLPLGGQSYFRPPAFK